MSDVSSVQRSNYILSYDNNVSGGVRIVNEHSLQDRMGDKVALSAMGRALAGDVAAMRAAAAESLSGAERYAAALAFGDNFLDAVREELTTKDAPKAACLSEHDGHNMTAVSKQGTVIGISSQRVTGEDGTTAMFKSEMEVLTIQPARTVFNSTCLWKRICALTIWKTGDSPFFLPNPA
jgi:hypothetical protein